MIIGLSGYARSGKDEAAKALVATGKFRRVAFADKLRDFLYALNPWVVPAKLVAFSPLEETKIKSVQWVIDKYGWNGYKETAWGPGIREYLQRLGSECGRDILGPDVWVNAALGRTPIPGMPRIARAEQDIVVTDVRFPNEAKAIEDRGGYIIRIRRPGVGAANSHYSETALDHHKFWIVIDNNGTIEDLHERIRDEASILRGLDS